MSGLLVSIKNQTEAILAIEAGVDILDIKDPDHGSLGMATENVMQDILDQCSQSPSIKTSAALGELEDWNDLQAIPKCLNQFSYLKVGSGEMNDLTQWCDALIKFTNRFYEAGIVAPQWIAALYADKKPGSLLANANQKMINKLAIQLQTNNFAGLLIDTAEKQNGSLLSCFQNDQLEKIIAAVQSRKMLCSLAGSLSAQYIKQLLSDSVIPNFYAVRGAVCQAGNRNSNVKQEKILELKKLLNETKTGSQIN